MIPPEVRRSPSVGRVRKLSLLLPLPLIDNYTGSRDWVSWASVSPYKKRGGLCHANIRKLLWELGVCAEGQGGQFCKDNFSLLGFRQRDWVLREAPGFACFVASVWYMPGVCVSVYRVWCGETRPWGPPARCGSRHVCWITGAQRVSRRQDPVLENMKGIWILNKERMDKTCYKHSTKCCWHPLACSLQLVLTAVGK